MMNWMRNLLNANKAIENTIENAADEWDAAAATVAANKAAAHDWKIRAVVMTEDFENEGNEEW